MYRIFLIYVQTGSFLGIRVMGVLRFIEYVVRLSTKDKKGVNYTTNLKS